jgi:predicted RNA polymerase sigma factor
MADLTGRDAVAAVWRIESARIVGALARYAGDFALAEDLAQEALAEALVTWPRDGVPGNPVGWLLTVGRRRAIDLELTAARFPAHTGLDGEPVLLEQQDRARWDQAAIRRGRAALARAEQAGRGLGAYALQAAIAECHAVAPAAGATNWERVVILYEALSLLAPSPVVDLNRAVAVAMAQGPTTALPIVDQLLATGAMPGSHLLPSVRGELLTRLGRYDEARVELERAVALCGNERERAMLRRKITNIADQR